MDGGTELRPDPYARPDRPAPAGNFERHFVNNRWPLLWFGDPSETDRRLVAQSGLFVVPGLLDQPLGHILESYPQKNPTLVKYVLPLTIRAEAMQALYRMNVTQATLFPDLDGLARAAAYELEVVWERLIDEFRGREAG